MKTNDDRVKRWNSDMLRMIGITPSSPILDGFDGPQRQSIENIAKYIESAKRRKNPELYDMNLKLSQKMQDFDEAYYARKIEIEAHADLSDETKKAMIHVEAQYRYIAFIKYKHQLSPAPPATYKKSNADSLWSSEISWVMYHLEAFATDPDSRHIYDIVSMIQNFRSDSKVAGDYQASLIFPTAEFLALFGELEMVVSMRDTSKQREYIGQRHISGFENTAMEIIKTIFPGKNTCTIYVWFLSKAIGHRVALDKLNSKQSESSRTPRFPVPKPKMDKEEEVQIKKDFGCSADPTPTSKNTIEVGPVLGIGVILLTAVMTWMGTVTFLCHR